MNNAAPATTAELKICNNGKDINDVLRETTHAITFAETLTYCRTIISLLANKLEKDYSEITRMKERAYKQKNVTWQCDCSYMEHATSDYLWAVESVNRMLDNACKDLDL